MDDRAKAVLDRTYRELECGARTLDPAFEFEQTLALEGFVIVPKIPTGSMIHAAMAPDACDYAKDKNGRERLGVAIAAWDAMVSASQQSATTETKS